MRWTKPRIGNIKIKKYFAILPVEVNREVRWLEFVKIKLVYTTEIGSFDNRTRVYGLWRKVCFIDTKEQEEQIKLEQKYKNKFNYPCGCCDKGYGKFDLTGRSINCYDDCSKYREWRASKNETSV